MRPHVRRGEVVMIVILFEACLSCTKAVPQHSTTLLPVKSAINIGTLHNFIIDECVAGWLLEMWIPAKRSHPRYVKLPGRAHGNQLQVVNQPWSHTLHSLFSKVFSTYSYFTTSLTLSACARVSRKYLRVR